MAFCPFTRARTAVPTTASRPCGPVLLFAPRRAGRVGFGGARERHGSRPDTRRAIHGAGRSSAPAARRRRCPAGSCRSWPSRRSRGRRRLSAAASSADRSHRGGRGRDALPGHGSLPARGGGLPAEAGAPVRRRAAVALLADAAQPVLDRCPPPRRGRGDLLDRAALAQAKRSDHAGRLVRPPPAVLRPRPTIMRRHARPVDTDTG
jgi:hypothetical protein